MYACVCDANVMDFLFCLDIKSLVLLAISKWENATCIEFVPRQLEHKDYVHFSSYPG